jgi:hypothetical protein
MKNIYRMNLKNSLKISIKMIKWRKFKMAKEGCNKMYNLTLIIPTIIRWANNLDSPETILKIWEILNNNKLINLNWEKFNKYICPGIDDLLKI